VSGGGTNESIVVSATNKKRTYREEENDNGFDESEDKTTRYNHMYKEYSGRKCFPKRALGDTTRIGQEAKCVNPI